MYYLGIRYHLNTYFFYRLGSWRDYIGHCHGKNTLGKDEISCKEN